MEFGPGLRFLACHLSAEEMLVVHHYADNQPGTTWSDAAALAGLPPQQGLSIRRKVRNRVNQYRQRQPEAGQSQRATFSW
jgi:hypothetical protein